MDNAALEKYWNEKYPKQRIIYSGRSISKKCNSCGQTSPVSNIKLDVRNLITRNDELLQEIIIANNLKGISHDDTMIRIQRWVCSNLKYVYDEQNQGIMEHWQFPFETLASGFGDCEDGAILIASLAINAGVPPFRIRVAAGFVQESPTSPTGGHGYAVYLRESDNQHCVIDWCFYSDPQVEIKDKPIMKNNIYYKQVWFSFNNEYAWGNETFDVTSRIKQIK